MASVANDEGGRRRIQFVATDGRRKTIRLGKMPKRAAEAVKVKVESLLASKQSGCPLDGETARWVGSLDKKLADKLARVGLIETADEHEQGLGEFLDSWLEKRSGGDYKPASLISWGQVIKLLKRFFGACSLDDVTPERAEALRASMIAQGLRPTTINKRLQHARMFFANAVQQGYLPSNPFQFVRHRPGDPAERRAYVPIDVVEKVMEHAPDATWRLLIALSRFAGLRMPSEPLSLRWQDVL